jgi:hypothetical protein
MKRHFFSIAALLLISSTIFNSCDKKDNPKPDDNTPTPTVEVKMANDLDATEKPVYFNLTTGATIEEDQLTSSNWDVKFSAAARSMGIAVNSGDQGSGSAGAQLVQVSFDDLKEAPESGYLPGNEAMPDFQTWAKYTGANPPAHAVLPIPGLTIVIKTANGNYAKMQILSVYKGNPNTTTSEFEELTTRPPSGYFTFRYATQTNGTRKF